MMDGLIAPPNTANDIDLQQAGADPEFEVNLARSIRSWSPQAPTSTSPVIPTRPPTLSRLRPLPSRTSGIRPPGASRTPTVMVSPDRGEQVVPRVAKPVNKRVRRHRY